MSSLAAVETEVFLSLPLLFSGREAALSHLHGFGRPGKSLRGLVGRSQGPLQADGGAMIRCMAYLLPSGLDASVQLGRQINEVIEGRREVI